MTLTPSIRNFPAVVMLVSVLCLSQLHAEPCTPPPGPLAPAPPAAAASPEERQAAVNFGSANTRLVDLAKRMTEVADSLESLELFRDSIPAPDDSGLTGEDLKLYRAKYDQFVFHGNEADKLNVDVVLKSNDLFPLLGEMLTDYSLGRWAAVSRTAKDCIEKADLLQKSLVGDPADKDFKEYAFFHIEAAKIQLTVLQFVLLGKKM